MVKEISLRREVAGYTPQTYFEAVYQGSACTQRFHKEKKNADDSQLSEWNGGRRVVVFTMALDAPAFLKRIVGVDSAKVTETQTVTFNVDGSITVSSVPVPNIPGGSKFTSKIETLLSLASDGGCSVHARVSCTAAGPYGLTGTIEGFMIDTAKASLQHWMDWIDSYLAELAPPPAAPAVAVGEEGLEEFFDAEERPPIVTESRVAEPTALPTPTSYPALPTPGELAPTTPLSFEEAVLLYLRYMCRSDDQSCALLESLDNRLRGLERDMREIRTAIVLPANSDTCSNGRSTAQQNVGPQQQPPMQNGWSYEYPSTYLPQEQQISLWLKPVSLRKALVGAGLLAATTAAVTAVFCKQHYLAR